MNAKKLKTPLFLSDWEATATTTHPYADLSDGVEKTRNQTNY